MKEKKIYFVFEPDLNKDIKYKIIYKISKNTVYILFKRTGSQHLEGSQMIARRSLSLRAILIICQFQATGKKWESVHNQEDPALQREDCKCSPEREARDGQETKLYS